METLTQRWIPSAALHRRDLLQAIDSSRPTVCIVVSGRGAYTRVKHLTGSFARPIIHGISPKLLAVRLAAYVANVRALNIWRKQRKRGKCPMHKRGCYKEQIDKIKKYFEGWMANRERG
jgi:hypothetical protein